MSATERVAALGSRSTISGWATISPSRKSSLFAHQRVHRRLDYPASLGLDPSVRAAHVARSRWPAPSLRPAGGTEASATGSRALRRPLPLTQAGSSELDSRRPAAQRGNDT